MTFLKDVRIKGCCEYINDWISKRTPHDRIGVNVTQPTRMRPEMHATGDEENRIEYLKASTPIKQATLAAALSTLPTVTRDLAPPATDIELLTDVGVARSVL